MTKNNIKAKAKACGFFIHLFPTLKGGANQQKWHFELTKQAKARLQLSHRHISKLAH